VRIASTDDRK